MNRRRLQNRSGRYPRETPQRLPSPSQILDGSLDMLGLGRFEKNLGWAPSLDGRASFVRTSLA